MMMESSLEQMAGWSVAALIAAVILLALWNLRLSFKLRRMRRDYEAMMSGSGVDNLDRVIADLQSRLHEREQEAGEQQAVLAMLDEAMRKQKGRIGVVRYNAFEGLGSDLSFSIAIVNERQDGVVITGIHNREETYVYAKPLESGESSYPLTQEERQAINQAARSI